MRDRISDIRDMCKSANLDVNETYKKAEELLEKYCEAKEIESEKVKEEKAKRDSVHLGYCASSLRRNISDWGSVLPENDKKQKSAISSSEARDIIHRIELATGALIQYQKYGKLYYALVEYLYLKNQIFMTKEKIEKYNIEGADFDDIKEEAILLMGYYLFRASKK